MTNIKRTEYKNKLNIKSEKTTEYKQCTAGLYIFSITNKDISGYIQTWRGREKIWVPFINDIDINRLNISGM